MKPSGSFAVWSEVAVGSPFEWAGVDRQVEILSRCSDAFLVPENHLGRASVSSLIVADRIQQHGQRAVTCINARDRNLLGLRRDLLTAEALGLRHVLFVYGDHPTAGERARGLTVRTMVEEARSVGTGVRVGVTSRLGPVPGWKRAADFLVSQVSFSLEALLRWRHGLRFDGPVYAGVIVLPSVAMAQRLAAAIPDLDIPSPLMAALAEDRLAGVEHAVHLIDQLRNAGGFAGVHLVAGVRARAMAKRLGPVLEPAALEHAALAEHAALEDGPPCWDAPPSWNRPPSGDRSYWNRTEMLSRRAMRRMASPNRPATETTSTLGDSRSG